MNGEQAYLNLCKKILNYGNQKEDRTNTGTVSVFGEQIRFDLSDGFPLLTTKKIPFHLIVSELLWFIKGDTNIRYLLKNNNNIWNEWAFERYINSEDYKGPDMKEFGIRSQNDPDFKVRYGIEMNKFKRNILDNDKFSEKYGDLGSVYGKQWRNWETSKANTIDQLKEVVDSIRNNPDSRRHIVTAWNPSDIPDMALPPCHTLFQFYVVNGKLSCQLYQRSADIFIGVPFNIASYALLTCMIAKVCGLQPGEFIHTFGDAHIYKNHIEQVNIQLKRKNKSLPKLKLNEDIKSLFDFKIEDISIEGYDPQPAIKAPIAV